MCEVVVGGFAGGWGGGSKPGMRWRVATNGVCRCGVSVNTFFFFFVVRKTDTACFFFYVKQTLLTQLLNPMPLHTKKSRSV